MDFFCLFLFFVVCVFSSNSSNDVCLYFCLKKSLKFVKYHLIFLSVLKVETRNFMTHSGCTKTTKTTVSHPLALRKA